ncbi:DUF3667 domain-containing protein [uncultured Algimonas sp.]|uniref:DUF3667 domain-containing protein n=1 Tax=uncultured Algimonas sp. TaxID=1547920 RepID=UPI002607274C|nr:DUF3667 domain-containing protein [uncultured Algimonas sp.]
MGTEEDILLGIDEGRGLLDRDRIPNENQSLACFSCGARMVGLYCHECGNKNDDYRRSVFSLFVELIQNLTAVDSRMWRSLRSLLLRPGRMARDFADGARSRWTSPVRFYIAASILLFGYVTLSQTQIIAVGGLHESTPTSIAKITADDSAVSPELHFFIRKNQLVTGFDPEVTRSQTDDFLRGLNAGRNGDGPEALRESIAELDAQIATASNEIERFTLQATRDGMARTLAEADPPETPRSPEDGTPDPSDAEESGDSGIELTGWAGREVSLDREGLRVLIDLMMERPELFNEQVNDALKLALFFMMPLAMLIGAIFIRGRSNAMLYDHLVHAAYLHAFSFILLLAFILLHQFTPATWLIVPYTLILLIYLPLSAKGMFGRGWFKSVLTAYSVGAIYSFVMFAAFVVIVAVAVTNVAADLTDQRARLAALSSPSQTAPPDRLEPQTGDPAPAPVED